MRIGQVATLATHVRQRGSGSIEKLVWLLARELDRLGHSVTVFATADSQVPGELFASLPGTYAQAGSPDDWQLCEWINLCRAVEHSGRFDLIHSHNYLWGLPLDATSRAPMVHTLHVMPDDDAARLRAMYSTSCVTGISRYQWSAWPGHEPAAVIHHGVDVSEFTFRPNPGDYLCFLGRFTPGKGAVQAIAAAREVGMRLVLAGPSSAYFREHIAPLVDGASVEYVGSVDGPSRDELLGGARALLYPIQEAEPFGLVLIEAMLCGTPVVALRRGAVPELVDEAITGYTSDADDRLAPLVIRAFGLDRRLVRERAATRFSCERMAREYLALYERQVSRS